MSNENLQLNMHAAVAKSAASGVQGIEAKCRAAFKAVRQEDMFCSGDNVMFNGALAGVVEDLGLESEDGKKVCEAARGVNKANAVLQAMASGVPVDLEAAMKDLPPKPALPLMQWWHESKT